MMSAHAMGYKTLPIWARLINGLLDAGVTDIEAVSFVSPKAVPKMADAAKVIAALDLSKGNLSALVPNRRGYDMALESGVKSIAVVLSATNTMNLKNINMDLDTTVGVCKEIVAQARSDGLTPRAYVSVAVECPFEGLVPNQVIADLTSTMFDAGAQEVIIADTIGAANPQQIRSLFTELSAEFDPLSLSAHFHDTRALALTNTWEALQCGIRKFDASIGGLGGCPFAPGAAGNLATEDLVSLLHQAGFSTGIDLVKLLDVVELARELVQHDLGGRSLAWQKQNLGKLGQTAHA